MKRFAISLFPLVITSYVYATPLPYPSYTSATGIPANQQIPMEALWLHLTAAQMGGVTIPKSFDASSYWPYMVENNLDYQTYRQSYDNGTCNVPADNSNNATIERAMQSQGLDIYDGAVWQIALALAAKNNPIQYTQDVEGYKNFLINGLNSGFQSYHAFTNYHYNGKLIPSEKNSYFLKFISPSWAFNYDSINDCNMQWPEWSAVTGEEAWAVLLGPVQSIYLLNDGANNPNWSSSSEAGDYIQLGKNALGAIQQMQAPSGGVYRNVTQPGQAQDFNISLENNFSLYAGLSILEQALKDRDSTATMHQAKFQRLLHSDQDDINTIDNIKKGLIQFFAGLGGVTVFNKDGNYFYSSVNGATPDTADFAVDVQTWGATIIATDPILLQAMTSAYGPDVMYNMFEAAINKSAYLDSSNNLLGVGYTAQQPSDNFYVLSGEWTLGAINAAIVLADYYKNDAVKSTLLISQVKQMLAGVTAEASSLQGDATSPTARISYLYANKRVLIPFGWYSNKMPATSATGWSLMVNSCFDPFELGGGNHQPICQQLKL